MTDPNDTADTLTDSNDSAPAVQVKGMKPIWFFVGCLLLVIGAIVTLAGIYGLVVPPDQKTVLYELHTGIWWGAVIVGMGLILFQCNKNKTI